MYAIIKTGGKQYQVAVGDTLKIETIKQNSEVGAEINLSEVLMVVNGDNVTVGKPLLSGASVVASVVSHGRGKKVRIFKMQRRKHYQRHQGHRQNYVEVRIDAINAG